MSKEICDIELPLLENSSEQKPLTSSKLLVQLTKKRYVADFNAAVRKYKFKNENSLTDPIMCRQIVSYYLSRASIFCEVQEHKEAYLLALLINHTLQNLPEKDKDLAALNITSALIKCKGLPPGGIFKNLIFMAVKRDGIKEAALIVEIIKDTRATRNTCIAVSITCGVFAIATGVPLMIVQAPLVMLGICLYIAGLSVAAGTHAARKHRAMSNTHSTFFTEMNRRYAPPTKDLNEDQQLCLNPVNTAYSIN